MSQLTTNAAGDLLVVIPPTLRAVTGWRDGDEVTVTLTMDAATGSRLVIAKAAPPRVAAGTG